MEATDNRPQLKLLKQTDEFKIFSVTAIAGAKMPNHISTQEAIVFIEEGNASLFIDGGEKELEEGNFEVISGQKVHSLAVNKDFRAKIVMVAQSEIKFK